MKKPTDLPLLAADEPPPFLAENLRGRSRIIIAVDHASNRIPRQLGQLGLAQPELERHIAWDIGSLGVARRISEILDAPLVAQNYSRLVIDCNRDPAVASSIPEIGEHTPIPGNAALSASEREVRRAAIFDPYHAFLCGLLDERERNGPPPILLAQHSMTPRFKDQSRAMHAAVMYNRDRRLAGLVLDYLRRDTALIVADNEPYFVSDATDYTIPRHGEARGFLHVAIEIRQDLIIDPPGQRAWGERIAAALLACQTHLEGEPNPC